MLTLFFREKLDWNTTGGWAVTHAWLGLIWTCIKEYMMIQRHQNCQMSVFHRCLYFTVKCLIAYLFTSLYFSLWLVHSLFFFPLLHSSRLPPSHSSPVCSQSPQLPDQSGPFPFLCWHPQLCPHHEGVSHTRWVSVHHTTSTSPLIPFPPYPV